jgi:hypothetical protein
MIRGDTGSLRLYGKLVVRQPVPMPFGDKFDFFAKINRPNLFVLSMLGW